jgi:hypothetical protein
MPKISALPAASDLVGNETVVMVKDGQTKRGPIGGLVDAAVAPALVEANSAKDAAANSADVAAAAALVVGTFENIDAGIAATISGQTFWTRNPPNLYLNSDGVPLLQAELATLGRSLGDFISELIGNNLTIKDSLESLARNLNAEDGAYHLGFRHDGEKARRRSIQAKLRDFVNVEDFRDPAALDDTAAMVDALDALGADGGELRLPNRPLLISNEIPVPLAVWKPVLISGSGRSAIHSSHNGLVFDDQTGNIRYENIRFVGPGLSNINAKAIRSILSQGWIRGCYFQGYRVGIDIAYSTGAMIERNQFALCQEGVRSVQVAPAFSNVITLRKNWFDFCTFGAYFDTVFGLTIDDNSFEYNAVGLFAKNTRLFEFRGNNWFENHTSSAFQIDEFCTGEIGKRTRCVGGGYTVSYGTSDVLDLLTPSICILNNSISQSAPHNEDKNVIFDTEILDPAGLHLVGLDGDQVFLKSGGFYEVVVNAQLEAFAAGNSNTVFVRASIVKNGAIIKSVTVPMLNGQRTQVSLATRERFYNGDVIRLQLYQNSGAALDILGGSLTQLAIRQISID